MVINGLHYCILETLWRVPASERWYYKSFASLGEQFGVHMPAHAIRDRLQSLDYLLKHGLLCVSSSSRDRHDEVDWKQRFVHRHERSDGEHLTLSISPKGFYVWETITAPQWERYHECEYQDICSRCADIVECSRITACDVVRLCEVVQYYVQHRGKERVHCVLGAGHAQPWNVGAMKTLQSCNWIDLATQDRERGADTGHAARSNALGVLSWRRVGCNKFYCEKVVVDTTQSWNVPIS